MASYRLYVTYRDGIQRELTERPDLSTDPVPIEFPFIVGNEASRADAERRARELGEKDPLIDADKFEIRLVLGGSCWDHARWSRNVGNLAEFLLMAIFPDIWMEKEGVRFFRRSRDRDPLISGYSP